MIVFIEPVGWNKSNQTYELLCVLFVRNVSQSLPPWLAFISEINLGMNKMPIISLDIIVYTAIKIVNAQPDLN